MPRPARKTDAWCSRPPHLSLSLSRQSPPQTPTAALAPHASETSLARRPAGSSITNSNDKHAVHRRLASSPFSSERRHPALTSAVPSGGIRGGGSGGSLLSHSTPTRGGQASLAAGALSMSAGDTDGGGAGEEAAADAAGIAAAATAAVSGGGGEPKEGVEGGDKVMVPWVSWVSLAMLLLVYVSNQWTRSLVYCECRPCTYLYVKRRPCSVWFSS